MSSKRRAVIFAGVLVTAIGLILAITLYRKDNPSSTIKLGSVLILTGEYKSYGEQFRDGAQLAVDEINQSERNQSPVQIIFYDSEGNKDLAEEKLKTLKERDNVHFVTEVMGTDQALNSIDYITKNKMLLVSGVNTGPELTTQGGPYFFRIIPSDGVASQQLARWAIDSGYRKGAIIHATDKWGTGLKQVLEKTYKDFGGELVLVKDSQAGQSIFQPIVTELKGKSPDVVFLVMYPREAGLLLKEARKQAFKTHFMGTDNFTGSELVQVGGDAVDQVMFVVPGAGQNRAESYQKFIDSYKRAYGSEKEPPLFTIMGYDCVQLMVQAIKASNGDVDKAREYLSTVKYEGISGPIAFDNNHDVIVKDYARKIYIADGSKQIAKSADYSR